MPAPEPHVQEELQAAREEEEIKKTGLGTPELRKIPYTPCIYKET